MDKISLFISSKLLGHLTDRDIITATIKYTNDAVKADQLRKLEALNFNSHLAFLF